MSRIHPDDRDRVRAALFDTVRQAQPFEFDHRIVRPDGEIRVLHNAGAVVRDESGAAVRVVGSCWDVTVSHETTERLRRSLSLLEATLDATADGILVVDLQGRVVAHNRRFLELWRLPPALAERGDDRAMVSSVSDQLEDPHAFETRVRDLYSRPEQEGFDVLRFKDGRAFERHSTPQFVGPDIVGRVWTFRDVTERERMLRASACGTTEGSGSACTSRKRSSIGLAGRSPGTAGRMKGRRSRSSCRPQPGCTMENRSILVVDDDDDVRTMLRILLSAEGYTVAEASDGAEALRRIRISPPDLVLLDLMMPRMSGHDLLTAMAADDALARVPVVILSDQISARFSTPFRSVFAFLSKPVELDELLAVVARAVRRPPSADAVPAG